MPGESPGNFADAGAGRPEVDEIAEAIKRGIRRPVGEEEPS